MVFRGDLMLKFYQVGNSSAYVYNGRCENFIILGYLGSGPCCLLGYNLG